MALVAEKEYNGERAVWLTAGPYEAVMLPNVGANLIAFRDTVRGYRFLHEPAAEEMEAFKARPIIHGIPVLFPPNRYEDGRFPWNGKTYSFPVNEARTGNHLHGFLADIPWEVEHSGVNGEEAYVQLVLKVDRQHAVYNHFPHEFTFRLRYTLSEDGLQQHVAIRNDGAETMPCLLAFHTALNAPFAAGSTAEDYRVKLTMDKRYEMSERMLPTGRFQQLSVQEEQLKGEGVYPFFEPLDNHYTSVPQNGRNRAELSDLREKVTLVYDAGASYKHWMIWNNNATPGFFCPEPQINLVNAPNVDMPAEQSGLFSLDAGEIWEETSRLYIVKRG
ncbi:aldose 1-epimerase [Paenibacillus hamazuiensis]|uniref:aldose 1-epimerase n=1 Tax=Paenibacillus hamazuiensis TaxID=2936508 RepID=UPI0020105A8B|nr:aldose 1-epimerase [Paenibacillus hamazuiensis]